MGLGQTLLSVGALILLGTLIFSTNTRTADSGTAIEMSEYRIMAASLGVSTLERATRLRFDENAINNALSSIGQLTTSGSLGSETGESETSFDDFDDYNGFSKFVQGDSVNFRTADFLIRSKVFYVSRVGNAVIPSATPTFHKQLDVWVSSPFMDDTVRYSSVYSYWYFR